MSAIGPVALPGHHGAWRLSIAGERIVDIAAVNGPPRWVALPPLVEVHAHLDRAYLSEHELDQPHDLDDAIARTLALRQAESAESVARRARRLLDRMQGHGVTHLRSHVDVDPLVRLESLRGVVDALSDRDVVADLVAFPGGVADPADPEVLDLLDDALTSGATMLGGVPWMHRDPRATTTAIVRLARAHDVGVDLHVDETTDVTRVSLGPILDGLEQLPPRSIAISHACALASMPPHDRDALIVRLAALGATVNVQPATNLHLQRASVGELDRRGVAPVRALLDAGVEVRFGSDNVADTFYPYGDGDPLETAFLAAITTHVDGPSALAGVCDGRRGLATGDVADLVLVPGASASEVLSRRPPDRVVIRHGRVVRGHADAVVDDI